MSDQAATQATAPSQEHPLQLYDEDPPPTYKAFDEGSSLESQIRAPPVALVAGGRDDLDEEATATTSDITPPAPLLEQKDDRQENAFMTLWLAMLGYSIACIVYAERARKSHSGAEFWCHSNHGSNLTTIVTVLFFLMFAGMLGLWKPENGKVVVGCATAIPAALWITTLVMMGIKSKVCGI